MQLQPPPTREQIEKIVNTTSGANGMPAPLKLYIAENLLMDKCRILPKFWIKVTTRKLIKKGGHERDWQHWIARLPKVFVNDQYETGLDYLPVFAKSVETDEEEGSITIRLTPLDYDMVGFDFRPEAMTLNMGDRWWDCKFDEPVWIDGYFASSFSTYWIFRA